MALTKQFSTELSALWQRRMDTLRALVIPKGVGKPPTFTKKVRDRLIVALLEDASRGFGGQDGDYVEQLTFLLFGSLAPANGCNPVGVDDFGGRFPRVARASQPWANRFYPVGVSGNLQCAIRIGAPPDESGRVATGGTALNLMSGEAFVLPLELAKLAFDRAVASSR